MMGFIGRRVLRTDNIGGVGWGGGGGGGAPECGIQYKIVFIRDSISEISP